MKSLREVIILTAMYYGKELSAELLELYVTDLADLNELAVIDAYAVYRRNPINRFNPLPAQIRDLVTPGLSIQSAHLARQTAGKIMGCISHCGWNNSQEAREQIGEVGWAIVKLQGGWSYLCENVGLTVNPSTLQAQLRDQLEGAFEYGIDFIEHKVMCANKRVTGELTAPNSILNLIQKMDPERQ